MPNSQDGARSNILSSRDEDIRRGGWAFFQRVCLVVACRVHCHSRCSRRSLVGDEGVQVSPLRDCRDVDSVKYAAVAQVISDVDILLGIRIEKIRIIDFCIARFEVGVPSRDQQSELPRQSKLLTEKPDISRLRYFGTDEVVHSLLFDLCLLDADSRSRRRVLRCA